MEKQENKLGIGEIGTIRDILMGSQIAEFQGKFEEADKKITALQERIDERLKQIESDVKTRLDELVDKVNNQLVTVNTTIVERTTKLEEKVESSSSSDKELLGKMLQEMGAKLLQEK